MTRIASMIEGKVNRFSYIPGELWTVESSSELCSNLLGRNERLTSFIQTQYGNCALVKAGLNSGRKSKLCMTPPNRILLMPNGKK